jgi:hypothetical protein
MLQYEFYVETGGYRAEIAEKLRARLCAQRKPTEAGSFSPCLGEHQPLRIQDQAVCVGAIFKS